MNHSERVTVLVGVTGGIAAYKSCELVRALIKRGYRVKVVMTEAATEFVTPLTFRTLTNEPVAVSLWEDDPSAPVHHISLADEADVCVIAPCTANVIAKIAHGRADDLLTTSVLATEAPIVIAPAMNVHMWRDEVTQSNVAALHARGVVFVEPAAGELACGDIGEGRLAPVEEIAAAVTVEAERARDLAGRTVLVTAGGTQEPIDPVRYIGNRSSGKTGFAIAAEAARRGARVTLVTGPTHLADPFEVEVVRIQTALEMHAAVMARVGEADAVVASAAVADFRPAETVSGKIKKDSIPEAITLVRNPDILAELGERDLGGVRIGFAAETSEVERHAREKLEAKRCHMVVANDVSDPALGFGTEANSVLFVTRAGVESSGVLLKRTIAREICDRLSRLLAGGHTA
ncbi:MAG: bifunctional phosphopantothenoylcysteine decarboxylase/phosphopantothenate--cysteine ligase CoaBC [Coriobacteriia bacterium]|nr:bifunctional phosphopantothenoylcysteine decarboxylase/phosphopantothenate--cysteine ligase CoaBC [Coriobacteriia bacterium]MBN2840543.1 bifunctional phosphopantothenoylcysteine decarboxylase/phosphopantothenate--cysteine ligase CoaBC [Coriobacteriia bacterium]